MRRPACEEGHYAKHLVLLHPPDAEPAAMLPAQSRSGNQGGSVSRETRRITQSIIDCYSWLLTLASEVAGEGTVESGNACIWEALRCDWRGRLAARRLEGGHDRGRILVLPSPKNPRQSRHYHR